TPSRSSRLGIQKGDKVKITTRRGEIVFEAEINGRGSPQKGMVFVPWFDQDRLINLVTTDAHDPLSKEPDYKNIACKIEKVS
ncbi:MAG: periplasmic nitrate reductase subunit alpha, partial [Actinobacteria bacterium]|nr:periplasmic nitrate reductase subunit alpha [Actinomycetota bacterium]